MNHFLLNLKHAIKLALTFTLGLALGFATLSALFALWTSLDNSYLDMPSASITARIQFGWWLGVIWRTAITFVGLFVLRGAWALLKWRPTSIGTKSQTA